MTAHARSRLTAPVYPAGSPRQTQYRVLLVEDNPAEAELVVESLSRSSSGDFDIAHVVSMDEAIRAYQRGRFDCIVLDLQLPDSAGVDTIRAMRAKSREVPIVAYSGLDDERSRAAALREGAQDFISKNSVEAGGLNRGILYAVERWRAIKLLDQFEGLFSAHPDAMMIMDQEGRLLVANKAACKLIDADHELPARVAHLPAGRKSLQEIAFSIHGAERLGRVRALSVMWDGEPATLVAIRDITEQAELAAKLRRAQKLEAIGRFAGGLAHDFGNTLSCIDVFADLLSEGVPEGANRDYLDGVKRAVASGRELVAQLISLEQSNALPREAIDIGLVLDEMEAFLRLALPGEIAVRVERQEEIWPVLIERGPFEQVVMNLALNARDAMPGGGSFIIACENAPDACQGRGAVHVRVSDTGPGIAPEHAKRVFDLFFTTKAKGQGTGLGLATCLRIIEQAGGTITLEPNCGQGATFLIALPRYEEEST